MITTSGAAWVLESGSDQTFTGSSIICEPTYFELRTTFAVRLRILGSSTNTDFFEYRTEVTKTEVDAEAGSGSQETAPWFDALQKAVKTKLVALNGSTTFTVV